MKGSSIMVDVHFSPWLRDFLFAAGELLRAVEEESALCSDEIREAAADLRALIDRG